jgi:hypothetical protein
VNTRKHCRYCGGGHVELDAHEANCVMGPTPASAPHFEDDKYSSLKDEARAERLRWQESDESYYGLGSAFR